MCRSNQGSTTPLKTTWFCFRGMPKKDTNQRLPSATTTTITIGIIIDGKVAQPRKLSPRSLSIDHDDTLS
jgi:hypothetical protein